MGEVQPGHQLDRHLQIGITGGQNLFDIPQSVLYLGNAVWLGVPAAIWICAALFAAGIRPDRVGWTVLMIGGRPAAPAGLLLTGRLASVASAQGFTVLAAAVIGG